MKETYVAALEIGSSKITGAVGVFTEDRTLRILALEQEDSRDSVRYGIIQNPEEVAGRVNRILERLNANPAVAPRHITGVYVGLSGRSMRSVESEVKLSYPDEIEFTSEILRQLRNDATTVAIDNNLQVLATEPRSYHIDGLETSSPKGAMGKRISATFDIIVGRTELKRNIQRSLTERTNVAIRGLIVTPLAAANIVLKDEEKRLGCMLVDFGAETTSVSIYRKGSLCYFATLPLGGRNITRDLTSLSILEEKAEEIKIESGKAIAAETPSSLNLGGIKLSDISNLVVARSEEIVANVIEQIKYAGLKEKDLPGGIICIGKGSQLNGLLELLEVQSGLNARLGHLPAFIQANEPRAKRPDTIQTAALLYAGALSGKEDCLEMPPADSAVIYDGIDEVEEDAGRPATPAEDGKVSKFFRSFASKFSNIFASPGDDESELD